MIRNFCMVCLLVLNSFCNAQNSLQESHTFERDTASISLGTIILCSGERLCLNAPKVLGKVNVNRVFKKSNSAITEGMNSLSVTAAEQVDETSICMDFNSITMMDGTKRSVLIINNPCDGVLYYRAKIYFASTQKYEEVSVGYLLKGISAIETWPVELPDIVLYDFRLEK